MSIPQLSVFFATCARFLKHVAGIKFQMTLYLQKLIKFLSSNIKYLVFAVYSIEHKLKRICKSWYSVFIYDLHNMPTSLVLGFVGLM